MEDGLLAQLIVFGTIFAIALAVVLMTRKGL
jgi:hypothetical protein